MEECSAMVTTNHGGDPEVEKQPQPKPVDPSSVSFVYSWMFSFIASVFNSISINDQQHNDQKIDFIEDKENTFIKNISTLQNNNNNNNNNSNIIYKQPRKTNFFSPSTKRKNGDSLDNQHQVAAPATNPMDFFSIYNQSIVLPACKKTLILDLDETLVHSTLTPVNHHHLTVNVTVEDIACIFYVIKRPHVDYFLERVAEWYDIVVFTASMKEYADPLLDKLDHNRLLKHRLFRDSCLEKDGNFVKDLSLINQDLSTTIIVDNSPHAYSHNVENALPIDSFMGDNPLDESLLTLLPFLEVLRYVNDVRSILSLRLTNQK